MLQKTIEQNSAGGREFAVNDKGQMTLWNVKQSTIMVKSIRSKILPRRTDPSLSVPFYLSFYNFYGRAVNKCVSLYIQFSKAFCSFPFLPLFLSCAPDIYAVASLLTRNRCLFPFNRNKGNLLNFISFNTIGNLYHYFQSFRKPLMFDRVK